MERKEEMPKQSLIELGTLEKGFKVPRNYDGPLPDNLVSRDLWNAWNTALREGKEQPSFGGGNSYTLVTEEVLIEVHEASGRPGSKHGLAIAKIDGRPVAFSPLTLGLELENGVLVLWDRNLGVHELRGAIL